MADTLLPNDVAIQTVDGPPFAGFDEMIGFLTGFNKDALGYERKIGFIAARRESSVVGGLYYRWYGPDANIDFLAVHKDWRKRGIGRNLMIAAEHELIRQGCRRLFVETKTFQAPAFYESLGYRPIATTPKHIGGFDRITLRKDLAET